MTATFSPAFSRLALPALCAAALALLSACGGGGGDGGEEVETRQSVTSVGVGQARYGLPTIIAINGTALDANVSISTPGCTGITRSTEEPFVSDASTGYYLCTVSAVGEHTINVNAGETPLAISSFTVPLPQVTMEVSDGASLEGTVVVTLEAQKTPITVNNFLSYVNKGFYDGTIFHRTVPGFVIQGGGFTSIAPGQQPPAKLTDDPIALEVKGLSNVQGTIAMARTNDVNSATSQFYFNLVDNTSLDPSSKSAGYAVFGHISEGFGFITQVAALAAATDGSGKKVNCMDGMSNFSECVLTPNLVITSATQTR